MDDEVLKRVESQLKDLEENIIKLRKSLRHWQALEVDYEGLQEELQIIPENASADECLKTAREYEPQVVDDSELTKLIKDSKSKSRTPQQLVHLLSKRVEYVVRNADSIRVQLTDAEKKRNTLLLAADPQHREEAPLPLLEITEELDDADNVISSKVEEHAAQASALSAVLEKAGVEGLSESDGKLTVVSKSLESSSAQATRASSSKASETTEHTAAVRDREAIGSKISESIEASTPAADTSSQPWLINLEDTDEEARLRREMLEYGLDEVGAIVAELNLEEGSSEDDYDEDDDDLLLGSEDDDDDGEVNDEEGESEDETGKAKNPTISTSYRRKMEELEKKLGLKDLTNLGPDPDLPTEVKQALNRPPAAEAARQAAIERSKTAENNDEADTAATDTKKKPKKSVAFAESLDIANEPSPQPPSKPTNTAAPAKSNDPIINPVIESIVERTEPTSTPPDPSPPPSKPTPKISRFKASRQSSKPPTQPPTPRPLLAPQILERPQAPSSRSRAPDPSLIDDELHRKQAALEYHKMRNRKVHDSGGYVVQDSDEEEAYEGGQEMVVDDGEGGIRKVSRFKSARMNQG